MLARASAVAAIVVSAVVWTPQTSGVTARLRGLSVVSERVVWASGATGTVLRTTDGGATWKRLAVPDAERLDFRDVDAFSDRIAYILSIGNGETSRIYKTLDGGDNWTLQLANKDLKVFLDAMTFWSADSGVAFSDSVDGQFVIFMTANGGRTWDRVPAERLPPALPNEGRTRRAVRTLPSSAPTSGSARPPPACCIQPIVAGPGPLSQTPLPTSTAAGIFSIAFRDSRHGVVVGGDYQKEREAVDNAAVTIDSGKTWSLAKGLSGFRSAVAHRPGSKLTWIAVGPQGADVSTDDGRSWKALEGPGFDAFQFAPTGRAGWGAGNRGAVARLDGF